MFLWTDALLGVGDRRTVAAVPREYSIDQAQAALAALRPTLDEIVEVRADVAELQVAVAAGTASPLGGLPELKAAQARLDELLSDLAAADVQVKGIAPLLLDFPGRVTGEPALLCWLEGDPHIGWYHRPEHGFMGRRRIP